MNASFSGLTLWLQKVPFRKVARLIIFAIIAITIFWLCFSRSGLALQLHFARAADSPAWRRCICSLLMRYAARDNAVRAVVVNELLAISRLDAEMMKGICTQAIEDNPEDPYFFYKRGIAHNNALERINAIADFEKALQLWSSADQYNLDFDRAQIEAALRSVKGQ